MSYESKATAQPPHTTSDFALGIFVFSAVLFLAGAWLWLKDEPFLFPAQRFKVMFHDVGGLNVNSAVYMDGVRIGTIESLRLQGKRKVLVGVKVNSGEVRVPMGSRFTIGTNGLVGARYLNIELPDRISGRETLLDQDTIAQGTDGVSTEVLVHQLAERLNDIDWQGMESRINDGLARASIAADNVSVLSNKLHPAAEAAPATEARLAAMADDTRRLTHRLNRMLDNPRIGGDLKETVAQAKAAADKLDHATDLISATLHDDKVRGDVLSAMSDLNQSTRHVENALTSLQTIGGQPELRADLKQIVGDAKEGIQRLDGVVSAVSKPTLNVRGTLASARALIADFDELCVRMNQVLDKRAPLLHLMVGRPGQLPPSHVAGSSENY